MKDKLIVEYEASFSKDLNSEIEKINQKYSQSKIGSYRKLNNPPKKIKKPERHHLNERSSFPKLYKKGTWTKKRLCIYLSGHGNKGNLSHHNCHFALSLMVQYCKEEKRKLKVWEYDLGLFLGLLSSGFDERHVFSIIELARLERIGLSEYEINSEIENPYAGIQKSHLKNIEHGVEMFFEYFSQNNEEKRDLMKKKLALLNSK